MSRKFKVNLRLKFISRERKNKKNVTGPTLTIKKKLSKCWKHRISCFFLLTGASKLVSTSVSTVLQLSITALHVLPEKFYIHYFCVLSLLHWRWMACHTNSQSTARIHSIYVLYFQQIWFAFLMICISLHSYCNVFYTLVISLFWFLNHVTFFSNFLFSFSNSSLLCAFLTAYAVS